MGTLLLEGGCEFQGKMAEPDSKALALAGGKKARIVIIPTAAAPDDNADQAGNNALKWFRKLGAQNVISLPIIDKKTAHDKEFSSRLKQANLVYILGGFPGFLEHTLRQSRCLDAISSAYQAGALLAGSSAGAMVLCEWYFDPAVKQIKKGFGILKNVFLIPHHDTFGSAWRSLYLHKIPNVLCIGIDEQTGMINEKDHHRWTVYGKGGTTVYHKTSVDYYRSGQTFHLPSTMNSDSTLIKQ